MRIFLSTFDNKGLLRKYPTGMRKDLAYKRNLAIYKNIVGRERQASQKKLNVKNRKGKFHVKNVIAEDIKTDLDRKSVV